MTVVKSPCSLWALLSNVAWDTPKFQMSYHFHKVYLYCLRTPHLFIAKQSWSIELPLLNENFQRVATSLQAFSTFRLSRNCFPSQGQYSNIVFTVVIAPGLPYMLVCPVLDVDIYCQGWDYHCLLLSCYIGNCTNCRLMRYSINQNSKGYKFLKVMVYASSLSSAD